MNAILDARTVAIVKPYTKERRQGVNGEFESEEVLFRIAVDRNYKVTRTENGKTVTDYPTDFWLAKATGPIAKIFADHCSTVKGDGKLQSRRLLLEGSFETYKKDRVYENTVNVDLSAYGIQGLVPITIKDVLPDTNTIFMVSSLKFLDKNPNAQQASAGAVATAGVAGVAVAGAGIAGAGVAGVNGAGVPVAQQGTVAPAQAPVAPAPGAPTVVTPAVVAGTSVNAQPGPAINPVEQAMNAPVVDPNFAVQGATAPF